MEVFREAKGDECSRVVKGKRSKRGRSLQLPAMSSTSSIEVSGTTTEEEEEVDMANCLILLAQGRGLETDKCEDGGEKFTSRRYVEGSGDGKPATYVYQCKTCNKCFASFQALGGHRTSHKRLKMAVEAKPKRPIEEEDFLISVAPISPDSNRSNTITTTITITTTTTNNNNNKSRVHECLICGLEFSSGQALGGHMRRHRPVITPASFRVEKKEKNVFSLDLNLPAPTDDDPSQPSSYGVAMVDCHY